MQGEWQVVIKVLPLPKSCFLLSPMIFVVDSQQVLLNLLRIALCRQSGTKVRSNSSSCITGMFVSNQSGDPVNKVKGFLQWPVSGAFKQFLNFDFP